MSKLSYNPYDFLELQRTIENFDKDINECIESVENEKLKELIKTNPEYAFVDPATIDALVEDTNKISPAQHIRTLKKVLKRMAQEEYRMEGDTIIFTGKKL